MKLKINGIEIDATEEEGMKILKEFSNPFTLGKKIRNHWDQKEIQIISENINKFNYLEKVFPNRTRRSIIAINYAIRKGTLIKTDGVWHRCRKQDSEPKYPTFMVN